MAYTKLFASIVTSTIWIEDDPTRIVWITMLALADKNGEVQGSVPGLARMAGVSVEACDAALAKFMSPDERSRTKTDEGRRIEEIDGGWLLLNYEKYRRMASVDDKKEKDAIRQRRARQRRSVTHSHAPVTPKTDKAEAEAEAEAEEKKTVAKATASRRNPDNERIRLPSEWRPSIDCADYARDKGLDPASTAEAFTDYFSQGRGRNEKRTGAGWEKRWRIWCNTDAERRPNRVQGLRAAASGGDAGAFARAAARLGNDEPVR